MALIGTFGQTMPRLHILLNKKINALFFPFIDFHYLWYQFE